MQNDYHLTVSASFKQTEYGRGTGEVVYANTRYAWSQLFDGVNGLFGHRDPRSQEEKQGLGIVDLDANRYLEAYFAVPSMEKGHEKRTGSSQAGKKGERGSAR
jgi:hypothetical protein